MVSHREVPFNSPRYIPDYILSAWYQGNLNFPQTLTGYKVKMGPLVTRDFIEGRLDINDLWRLRFAPGSLDTLSARARDVHARINIPARISPQNIEILWSHALNSLADCQLVQIVSCLKPSIDQALYSLSLDHLRRTDVIHEFFSTPKFAGHYPWILTMWETIASSVDSRLSKGERKLIFQTLIDMRHSRSSSPDHRGETVLEPLWENIRERAKQDLSLLDIPFSRTRKRRLIDQFVRTVITSSVPQSASQTFG